MTRRKYRKKAGSLVAAVQLNLDTEGFSYEKWGGTQTCKAGDWLVDNDGNVYTVSRKEFARTYRDSGGGRYEKTAPVWAETAAEAGHVHTEEGVTDYDAGDYIIYDDPEGKARYAISADSFEKMYEPVPEGPGETGD